MNKTWKPLLDRVIVKQDPAPSLLPASHPNASIVGANLVIPDDQRENYRPHTGIIVAVGPGMYVNGNFCPVAESIKPGAHVMFTHPDTLTRIEHNGSEHLLMRETDVLLDLDI